MHAEDCMDCLISDTHWLVMLPCTLFRCCVCTCVDESAFVGTILLEGKLLEVGCGLQHKPRCPDQDANDI